MTIGKQYSFVTAALLTVGLAACAPDSPPKAQDLAATSGFSFDCGAEQSANVRFVGPDTVELQFLSESYILPRERSASGAKYTKDGVTFWNKGNEALITVGEVRFECSRNASSDN